MSLPVSTSWKNAIQAQFRYPGYLHVELAIAPPNIVDHTSVSNVDAYVGTQASSVIERQRIPEASVLSLEHNRWCLDGTMTAIDDPAVVNRLGWWSVNPMESSSSCVFQFTFDQLYDVSGLYIRWDRQTNSWATTFTITGFDTSGTSIASKVVSSPTASDGYYEIDLPSVKSIKVTFQGWSKPQWRARMEFLVFGQLLEFNNDRIQGADYEVSTDLLSGALPTMQCSIEATNYDKLFDPTLKTGAAANLARQQQLKVQWGFETSHGNVEWLREWPMYLDTWSVPADERTVKLTAISRLQFMSRKYIYGQYTGTATTFQDIATTLMENSSVIKEGASERPWQFDPVLAELKTRAPLPVDTEKALLQLIANATGCYLDTNVSNGYIRIHKPTATSESAYTLSANQQLGDPSFKVVAKLKSIKVSLHTFAAKNSKETVYSFDGLLSGTATLQVEFGGGTIVQSPTVSITGATLVSSTFYARAGILVVQAPESSTEVSIKITGTIIEDSITWIETYNDATVLDGLEVSVDNALITEMKTLQVVADATKNFYLQRTTTTIPYLGYPDIEVTDRVDVKSLYGNFAGTISKAKLSFNGGFEGSLEVHNE